MQGKGTTNSTFNQLFEPIFSRNFRQLLQKLEVDKYVKKLTAFKFIILIVFAQLEQLTCLREISNSLCNKQFSKAIGLSSISFSQISRKLRNMMLKTAQSLFQDLVRQVGVQTGFKSISQELGRLHLIDSSTISLCLTRYRWASFRKTKSGIKIHLRLKLFEQGVLPDAAIITNAKTADKTQMDKLIIEEKDVINVFDRAYIDYKKFDEYCEKGILFVSRLKKSALVEVIKECPLTPGSKIKKDRTVILGKEGTTKMHHPLRCVETEDLEGNAIVIVTNVFKQSAEEIGDIYIYRWQIELFFKWIKQHLQVKHFYGYSQRAVEMQLYIALITYCLLKITQLKTGYEGPLLQIQRLLKTCLYEPFSCFIRKLYRKPERSSKGRRKIDHERIYQETLRQVIAGEADHLDDLTYDPVIL
ncbi:MAG TPA: IS4 family transposase [Firmicutes bacterium]|nr:IS4 family transposase [Bacillota bacterium]